MLASSYSNGNIGPLWILAQIELSYCTVAGEIFGHADLNKLKAMDIHITSYIFFFSFFSQNVIFTVNDSVNQ